MSGPTWTSNESENLPVVGDLVTFQVGDNPSLIGTGRVLDQHPEGAYGLRMVKQAGDILLQYANGDVAAPFRETFGPWRPATAREARAFEAGTPDLEGSAEADSMHTAWDRWAQMKAETKSTR